MTAAAERAERAESGEARAKRAAPPEAGVEELAGQLRVAVNRLSFHLRRPAAEREVTPTRLSVLTALEKGGPQRLGDLAGMLGISAASMSRLREVLEDGGWVAGDADPSDLRACRLRLTEAGAALLEETRREGTGRLTRYILDLDADQRHVLEAAVPILISLADRHLVPEEGR